jgi:hypothetical protein
MFLSGWVKQLGTTRPAREEIIIATRRPHLVPPARVRPRLRRDLPPRIGCGEPVLLANENRRRRLFDLAAGQRAVGVGVARWEHQEFGDRGLA